jgi:hypothetical protein
MIRSVKGDGNDGKHGNYGRNEISQDRLLPPRGDYQTLHSFHKAEVVFDITFRFTRKFLAKG